MKKLFTFAISYLIITFMTQKGWAMEMERSEVSHRESVSSTHIQK